MFIIVGLGNPGEEYTDTRHNTGRMVLDQVRKAHDFSEWTEDKKNKALVSERKIGKEKMMLLLPETFMNKSGVSLKNLITSEKKAEHLVVVHDDLDLAIGKFKISFNRGSGGHKGVESITRAIKTEKYIRIRVGISPPNAKGVVKKPKGEEAVSDFILGKFKKPELDALKKVCKHISEAVSVLVLEGKEMAMGKYNSM